MVRTTQEYLFLFFSYAFLGWCMEMIYMSIREKRITKRGFLLGPCCPIYGFGLVGITMLLQHTKSHIFLTFLTIIILCSFFEYAVSALMERVFHTRWWDYHDMKYNIRGRICLETMLPFGILGSFALYHINPFLIQIVYLRIPIAISNKLLAGAIVLFLIDLTVSVRVLHTISLPQGEADHTAEISKRVREALTKRLQ